MIRQVCRYQFQCSCCEKRKGVEYQVPLGCGVKGGSMLVFPTVPKDWWVVMTPGGAVRSFCPRCREEIPAGAEVFPQGWPIDLAEAMKRFNAMLQSGGKELEAVFNDAT